MSLYLEQFAEKYDFKQISAPSKTLIIASTARCGSHMLGHALHQTGCFGFPLEYTNPSNLVEWKKRFGVNNVKDVITNLQACRTSPNGVFGIKIHYSHVKEFGGFAKMVSLFPGAYFVLLSREDVLKQAVSLSIAQQTGSWIDGQKGNHQNVQYRYKNIERCLKQTIIDNASWRYKLAASGCKYIEMNFHSVRNDLAGSIQQIADWIGIELRQQDLPTSQITKKQSSDINDEWAERFKAEFRMSDELIEDSLYGRFKNIKKNVRKFFTYTS